MNPKAFFRSRWLSVGLGCLFGAASPAAATVWMLANGDRLTGELVAETETHIEVEHPQLGRLTLARSALVEAEKTEDGADEGLAKAADEDGAEAALFEESGYGLKAGATTARPKWRRQVELGYAQQAGSKEKQDLSLRLQLDGRTGANTFRATGRVLRSDAEGETVTDRREAEFRWRYDLNKRLFTQTQTNYEEDEVRQIGLSLEQQLGGGYRVIDSPRQKVNVGLGAVLKRLERNGTDEHTALLGSLFQDYSFRWNSRFKLVQEARLLVANSVSGPLPVEEDGGPAVARTSEGNYRFKLNTAMQSKVSANLSLSLRYEYDYDNSISDVQLRADQRLTTALGYIW